ncbi:C-type lectin domain family 4 member G-like [Echeneis naucrates]|uniref:C-type lectin domain family 4 member G-like n=1 Tax=Echeneis naucrates TaxID=173247 RepID=A0A665UBL3_ECHNA|nr:C-type lectin domain family 4 member G-like [Echeneis naucrates]
MEEELNYITVVFEGQPKEVEGIYDEVTTQQRCDTDPVLQVNKERDLLCTLLCVVAAGLAVICVILVSVVIALSLHLKTVMSGQNNDTLELTEQNRLLKKEKMDLERRTKELSRERDRFNWTIGVILQHDSFSVNAHCPQKVCRPCLDSWVPFQSKCYLFANSDYSSNWMTWLQSRDKCREKTADLVVIESQEEQEFISNHTEKYNDDNHGYWIGLNKDSTWMWADGSNLTFTFWSTNEVTSSGYCVLSSPHADPSGSWKIAWCRMKNRYICETRALIKPDLE